MSTTIWKADVVEPLCLPFVHAPMNDQIRVSLHALGILLPFSLTCTRLRALVESNEHLMSRARVGVNVVL